MNKLFIYNGASKSGKTETMLRNLEKLHRDEGADKYIFLGASGGLVRSVRERFLEKVGSIFNDQFKVIDQYVVEKMKEIVVDKTHVSSDFIAAVSSDLVSDNTVLGDLIRKGNGINNAFIKFYSIVKERNEEFILSELESSESGILKEFVGIYRKFQKEFESLNLFSTQDAYNMFSLTIRENRIPELEITEKHLFIDGFLDLSEMLIRFLVNLSMLFENVHISFPTDTDGEYIDDSFQRLQNELKTMFPTAEIEEIDCGISCVRGELQLYFDAVESDSEYDYSKLPYGTLEFLNARNIYEEVYSVCSYVKHKILVDGYSPEDIAVIIRDSKKYGELISKILEEMQIPYRFDGDEMLLNSVNINRLLLPFKAFYSGFSPEYLVTMIESGYTENTDMSLEDFRSIAYDAGLYDARMNIVDEEQWPKSLKSRKEEWNSKLERYEHFIRQKKKYSDESADRDDICEYLDRKIEIVSHVRNTVDALFEYLASRFLSNESRVAADYQKYFVEDFDTLDFHGMISHEESENNAVDVFFNELMPEVSRLIYYLGRKNHGKLSPLRYWKYLRILLENSSYKKSSLIDNRVMLLDVENARFRDKKVKIFTGMTDRCYPKISIDDFLLDIPIYEKCDEMNRTDLRDEIIRRDFRDLIFSMRNTGDCILLSLPIADLKGKPIFPSMYLKRLSDIFGEDYENRKLGDIFDEYRNYSKKAFMKDLISEEKINWDDESGTRRIFELMELDYDRIKNRRIKLVENISCAYDLNVEDHEVYEALIKLFGTTLSASRYKTIKECGKKFYLQNLLKIPTEEEKGYGFQPFEEGSILHAILFKAFSRISSENITLEEMEESETAEILDNYVRKYVEHEVRSRIYHQSDILSELEFERIVGIIGNFFERYRNPKGKNNPGRYEKSVYGGMRFFPSEFEISIDEKDGVKVYNDPKIYLIGKIDRIDKSEEGHEFIIDYKSSDTSASKSKMQLFLYALARSAGDNRGKVAGMAFMSLKSDTKTVAKQFFLFNPDEGKYENKSPRSDEKLSLDEFSKGLEKDISIIFSGKLDYDDQNACQNCSFSKNGSCKLRSAEKRQKL